MAGRLVPLVVIAAAVAGAAACAPDLPRELSIESRFTDAEAAVIEDAIDEVNRVLGVRLMGGPVLIDRGRFLDPDGFHLDDFDSPPHGVYVLEPGSDEYRWLGQEVGRSIGGYATLSDVLILPLDAMDGDEARFRVVVLHELGHFLGMTHNPDPSALMNGEHVEATTFTLADQRAFCLIYDCVRSP